MLHTKTLLLLLMLSTAAAGQSLLRPGRLHPSLLSQQPYQRQENETLYYNIDILSFMRNAEYMMPFTVGYTSINYRIAPTLIYTLNNRTQLHAGFLFDGIVGSDSLIRLFPLFRFEYHPMPWMHLVLGSLYGNATHDLDDPIRDRERTFFSHYYHPEAGVQILTHTSRWQADTWIDWEHYLNPWTYSQERFTMATHHEYYWQLPDSTHRLEVSTPATLLVAHRGGQFSLVDTNNESLLNMHAGLRLSKNGRHHWQLYLPLYYYKNISGPDRRYNASEPYHTAYLHGWGAHPQVRWQHTITSRQPLEQHSTLYGTLGFWRGHHYISPRGSYLYQSICWTNSETLIPERRMITLDGGLEHHYKNLDMGVDIQLYFDLTYHKADYAYGLYLRCNLTNKIKTLPSSGT